MKTATELREYHRKWRAANPEKVKAHMLKQRDSTIVRAREWRKKNPERALAGVKKWQRENHSRFLFTINARTAKMRAEVLAGYGHRCACCGEDTPEFLTVDHIKGAGVPNKNRHAAGVPAKSRTGYSLYRWLKVNGYPRDEFRLLCFNCNSGRKLGPCPHERSRPVLVPFE
jgi:hypothetical protein